MIDPSRSKSTLILIVLLVFAIVAGSWLLFQRQEAVPEVEVVKEDTTELEIVEEPTEQELEPEQEAPAESRKGTARRIVHVTGEIASQALDTDIETVNSDNIVERTSQNLEAALNGDMEAAHFVYEARETCNQIPRNQNLIERIARTRTDMAVQMQGSGIPVPPEGTTGDRGVDAFFPTLEQNQQHWTKWYDACSRFEETFGAKMRRQLETLANNGNVIARYLYATWKPVSRLTVVSFEEMQEWQMKALDYSYANLQEGEALGLLAFGVSYRWALFTASSFDFGFALQKAAVDCGISHPAIMSFVNAIPGESENAPPSWENWATTTEDVMAMADALYQRYCR
jgi:hypothetical protein